MTAAERIQEIERKLKALSFPTWEMSMTVDDVQWLVEQARQFQRLKEQDA